MSKADVIEVEGTVVEKLPNAMFQVEHKSLILYKCDHSVQKKEIGHHNNYRRNYCHQHLFCPFNTLLY